MTEENKELLGSIIDTMESYNALLPLPLPAQMHIDQFKKALPDWSAKLKEIYIEENKENPWE